MFGTSGGQYMLRGQCVLGGASVCWGAVCAGGGGQCVPDTSVRSGPPAGHVTSWPNTRFGSDTDKPIWSSHILGH